MTESDQQAQIERVRALLEHGQKFGNTSVVVRVDDLAALLSKADAPSSDPEWTVVADNGGEYINSDLMEKGDRVTFILETKRRTRIIRIERPVPA